MCREVSRWNSASEAQVIHFVALMRDCARVGFASEAKNSRMLERMVWAEYRGAWKR